MYSLMIADDEVVERKAFRLLVKRNLPEVVVLEDAVNGLDFLQKVEQYKPDISVVDIDMPGMDGLEAIKALKEKDIHSKIIIHTAYSTFQYAQEAVSLGARDYLLKPAKMEKVIATIKKCITSIEQEKEDLRLRSILKEVSQVIETDFLSSMLIGDIEKNKLINYLDILGIKFKSGYILSVCVPEAELFGKANLNMNILKSHIQFFMNEEMENAAGGISSSVSGSRILLFIHAKGDSFPYDYQSWSAGIKSRIREKMLKDFNIRVTVEVGQLAGDKCHSPGVAKASPGKAAVSGAEKEHGEIFFEADYQNQYMYENEFCKYIRALDFAGCKKLAAKTFSEIGAYRLDSAKDILMVLISSIQRYLLNANYLLVKSGCISNEVIRGIENLSTHEQLEQYFGDFLRRLIVELSSQKKVRINNFVKQSIEYINKHYMEDISLVRIADAIGITTYYLSRLFKKELNENFVDFLTEIRIKQALSILSHRDCSIKELSESVGYNNPTYFCKVFKKATGKTISSFKANIY